MPGVVLNLPAAPPPKASAAERLRLKRGGDVVVAEDHDRVVAKARAAQVQLAVDPDEAPAPAKPPSRLVAALAAQAALDGPVPAVAVRPAAAQLADFAVKARTAKPKAVSTTAALGQTSGSSS